ncbi:MAG: ABC transporter permease DevC [Planctomycetota bacterium]
MSQKIGMSWQQLKHEKMKLFAAVSGVMVSVVLMWMQLGLMKALFASAVVLHGSLAGELVLIHSQYEHLLHSKFFSSRLLYRLKGSPDVVSVSGIYLSPIEWKNPWNGEMRSMQCYGIETDAPSFDIPGLAEQLPSLRRTDVFLYDRLARPRFGDVVGESGKGIEIEPELNRRKMKLEGLVNLGASFGVDGNLLVSHANFLRLFPDRDGGQIDLGVVRLKPGVSVRSAQKQFQQELGKQVLVLTKEEFAEVELKYWKSATPIGIIFTAGTFVGFFIGFIVVYQILYTDVTNHLPQYATMKAMGFSNAYLRGLILEQSFQLGMLGFVPGTVMAGFLYAALRKVTQLPLFLDPARGIFLAVVTVLMCVMSGLFAIRKLSSADPAEVF